MRRSGGARGFDPVVVGHREADAWVAYYRREWGACLRAMYALVAGGFGMGPWRTTLGAWWVLRANQAWAPYPDNDPAAARALMRRFYDLVARDGALSLDPVRAAELEVAWWRLHREHQHDPGVGDDDLVEALMALYAYVYETPAEALREAARQRVRAMDLSDAWVAAGCALDDPLLAAERRALVASYSALREAVERAAAV